MNAAALISTAFGIGRSPVAPGTVASAVALPIAWVVQIYLGSIALAVLALVMFGAGVWASAVYARDTGNDDPSECVIDEVAGQWLACAFGPVSIISYVLAFALFRLFDISKIWPVSWGEAQRGGLGIMLDDLIAGAMAGIIVAVVHNAGLI
ncbi:MAG TPA: phosphatidylglycerophosphatase A [Rhizomicrobium sp.]|jgi:phosphatidylglycerophosphatase A|nr:phosphatidylglycerophosphatase A [Rhizomicrobium sp.]